MARSLAKKMLENAVDAMQVHLGCRREVVVRVRDQEKLYRRVMKRIQGIAKTTGLSVENAWDQI